METSFIRALGIPTTEHRRLVAVNLSIFGERGRNQLRGNAQNAEIFPKNQITRCANPQKREFEENSKSPKI